MNANFPSAWNFGSQSGRCRIRQSKDTFRLCGKIVIALSIRVVRYPEINLFRNHLPAPGQLARLLLLEEKGRKEASQ
ncbi:hypothetical protein NKI54_24575 [Mesorhizobium sp. M0663]|uniref:hypothetical protein n=1 Tax=Mesorhizobium sp. M0663 TaxID=2956981 RepID=UPI00333D31C7